MQAVFLSVTFFFIKPYLQNSDLKKLKIETVFPLVLNRIKLYCSSRVLAIFDLGWEKHSYRKLLGDKKAFISVATILALVSTPTKPKVFAARLYECVSTN